MKKIFVLGPILRVAAAPKFAKKMKKIFVLGPILRVGAAPIGAAVKILKNLKNQALSGNSKNQAKIRKIFKNQAKPDISGILASLLWVTFSVSQNRKK